MDRCYPTAEDVAAAKATAWWLAFWRKVEDQLHVPDLGPCWVWTASTTRGYAQMSVGGKVVKAHSWLWAQQNGPVPEGLELDHLCRVRACIRPAHLEPVTHQENIRRRRPPSEWVRRQPDMSALT